ncbi:MAG TPA: glycine cleavage system aminomethyltransferase GcvT [Candidatus Hydrogenedentes bacterium]|nr:glycine cleavage system aminomethyltransferase GcvT [Candidatus Hydrogenedentota bacterium]HQM49613.1 glycine cleavage system aminomethyltransferase GcvT [Candidatus Hydrogenedentota bacterium]
MRQTPLFDEHRALGGKIVDFTGWALPVQFAGILNEHEHTRAKASLFDCSHMGEFCIKGERGIQAYDALVTMNAAGLAVGRARYGFLLTEGGGIIDDLIAMRVAEDELFVVTNAGPLERVATLFAGRVPGLRDVSDETAKIDIQGPLSREILVRIGLPVASDLRYFGLFRAEWEGHTLLVSRTGYTGELGYELFMPNDLAVHLWRTLLRHPDVAPAGLGARDTLRLEMGYSLSGQDFDDTRSPLEASQEAFVDWSKEFTGRAALEKQRERGAFSVLTAIRADSRRAPRHGFEVYKEDDAVGLVTSGTYGPSVGCGIGLAYLPQELAKPGTALATGPRRFEIETTQLPFYRNGTCRN